MNNFAIARDFDEGKTEFLREEYGPDCYTDDIGCAIIYDERSAIRELIDDEYPIKLKYDIDDGIEGYERVKL